jgi:hypothetical protein
MTYAGLHSAASRAFNQIPKQARHEDRRPTLVIYEDAYALADLESPEQYRIFIKHVLPSERMWGGMVTVFVETAQPKNDWEVLRAYSSVSLDLRSDAGTRRHRLRSSKGRAAKAAQNTGI